MKHILLLTALLTGSLTTWAQESPMQQPPAPDDVLLDWSRKERAAGQKSHLRHGQQTIVKPTRAVRYDWNAGSGSWTSPALERYTYDARGNLTEILTLDSATVTGPLQRIQYVFDNQNRATDQLYQEWRNGAWSNTQRYTVTYDSLGSMTSQVWQRWQPGAQSSTTSYRYINTYSAAGMLSEQIMQRLVSGTFVNFSRHLITSANNRWTDIVYQNWQQGAWVNSQRTTNINWFDWPTRRFAYYRTQQWADTGVWGDWSQTTVAHSPNGTTVWLEEILLASGAIPNSRDSEIFDNFGNFIAFRAERWSNGAWRLIQEESSSLLFDAANNVRRKTTQFFNVATSNPVTNVNRYNYSNYQTIVLGTKAKAIGPQVKLYPNPTAGTATLELVATGEASITVLNALGQPVQQLTARPQAGVLRQSLNTAALPAGVYSVRVSTAAGTTVQQLVRQ